MMRARITAEAADVDVCITASGAYSPDVMHDLTNRAREAFRDAVTALGTTAEIDEPATAASTTETDEPSD